MKMKNLLSALWVIVVVAALVAGCAAPVAPAAPAGDAGAAPVAAFGRNDILVVVIGTVAYFTFAFLHESLIGVAVR